MNKSIVEVWGCFSYRAFRINWMLEEFKIPYEVKPIRSRTGETQTAEYLSMNPKGKIPILKYNNLIITESIAAMNYIANCFKKPNCFYIPSDSFNKAKIDEWIFFCAMELDCLSIYTVRRHAKEEKNGLAKIYGEAPKAVDTAKKHFTKMLKACEDKVPKINYLFGQKVCTADVMLMSCLQVKDFFDLDFGSKKISEYYNRLKNRPEYIKALKNTYGEDFE